MDPRSRTAVLAECDSILHKENFTREDSARIESLFQFADRLSDDELTRPNRKHARPELENLPVNKEFRAYLAQGKEALSGDRRREIARQIQGFGIADTGAYLVPASFSQQYE